MRNIFLKNKFYLKIANITLLILVVAIMSQLSFAGLYEKVALAGFSPIHYADLILHPQNFIYNFPSGVEAYKHSLIMSVYPLLAKEMGIRPEVTMKILMVFEYLSFYFMSYSICLSFFNKKDLKIIWVLFFILSSSYAWTYDLANFSYFVQGQFYNFAYLFSILGITHLLKERYYSSAIFMAISVSIHTIIGLLCILLSIFSLFLAPKKPLHRNFLLPFFLLLLFIVFWYISFFSDTGVSVSSIASDLWVKITRMGSCHWYPYHLGIITENPFSHYVPYLCFLLLLISYFPVGQNLNEIDKKVSLMIFGALLLSALGVFISIYFPSPFLVKLALHRASVFPLLLGLPYLIKGIADDVSANKNVIFTSFSILILILPFFYAENHFMIVPTFTLVFMKMKDNFLPGVNNNLKNIFYISIISLIFGLIIYNFINYGHLNYNYVYKFFDKKAFLILSFIFSILLINNYLIKINKIYVLLILVVFSAIYFHVNRRSSHEEFTKGVDYLTAQKWAKNNTPNNSVFLVDPSMCYGWRDFSQRSSFGCYREWSHVSWLYNFDKMVFDEGMRRLSIFGIQMDKYINGYFPNIIGNTKLIKDIEKNFYNINNEKFLDICAKEKINYLVMQKRKIHQSYSFPIAFENQHFIVYQVN